MTVLVRSDLLRCACSNDASSATATLRTQINDMISHFDHVEVVFNDEYCISFINQAVDDLHKHPDIFKMQSGGRLVQYIKVFPVSFRLSSSASLTRCASPPDKVVLDCPSLI